ncbi:MAG: hypothetical protein ABI678_26545 [Kofleriaceae bacterium]
MKWTALLLITVAACGPSTRGDDDDFGGDGGNHGSNGSGGSNGGDGCSDASKLIYVVDINNQLSQYDPTSKAFHDLGALACESAGTGTPFSMGVDRNANAYVLYIDGKLFKVDTQSASLPCTATAWHSTSQLLVFGMGFSTTVAGGDVDELYVAGGPTATPASSVTLAQLDVGSFTAATKGTVQGSPELTGNANGELWGFFPDATNPRIAQLNKANATPISPASLPSSMRGDPLDWAFAFYGGNYYVFLLKADGIGFPEPNTTVYEVSPTGALMSSTPAPGRSIVGAGVSTCAPVVIGRQ